MYVKIEYLKFCGNIFFCARAHKWAQNDAEIPLFLIFQQFDALGARAVRAHLKISSMDALETYTLAETKISHNSHFS